MQDEDLDLNVNQKLDRILDNQRVLFKLVSDLLRETRTVNSGGGMGGSSQSIDYVERVGFVRSSSGVSALSSSRLDGRASSGVWDRDTAADICGRGNELSSSSSGRDTEDREYSSGRSATNLSLGHEGRSSSFQTSSFAGEGGDMEGEEGDSFLQEAVQLKSGSSSVGNFVRKIVQVVFQPEELQNRNCSGTRGKEILDQVKLGVVKKYVFKLYPCVQTQQATQWRKCVVAINEFLRRGKSKGNVREQ